MSLPIEQRFASLIELGKEHRWARRFAKAQAAFERALELAEETWGPMSIQIMSPLGWLSIVRSLSSDAENELRECLALDERALRIAIRHYGADDPRISGALWAVGKGMKRLGNTDEALAHLVRAVDLRRRDDTLDTFTTRMMLADVVDLLCDRKRFSEALPYAERNLALVEREGAPPVARLPVVMSVARCRYETGDARAALAHLEAIRTELVRSGRTHGSWMKEVEHWISLCAHRL